MELKEQIEQKAKRYVIDLYFPENGYDIVDVRRGYIEGYEQALKDAVPWTDEDMRKSYSEGERFGSQEVLLGESLINESDADAKDFEPFLEELKQSKTS